MTSPAESPQEKRAFLRITTHIPCQLRRLAPGERQLYHGCPTCSDNMDPQSFKGSGMPEPVVTFLLNLDAKLDMILSQTSQRTLKDDFPMSGQIQEISAAGMKFESDASLREGMELEAVITLSQAPMRMAGARGVLVRSEDMDGRILWMMEFTSIKEPDQEAIVQFVFQEQRARIRERKGY